MEKFDWIIHYVQEHTCECCNKHDKPSERIGFDAFANIHTHGFNEHNHDEMCISLDIGFKLACALLNSIGIRIRNGEAFEEGIRSNVIKDYNVLFYRSNYSDTLYLLLPDPNGLLPGDDSCMHPYNLQKIYADIIEEDNVEKSEYL